MNTIYKHEITLANTHDVTWNTIFEMFPYLLSSKEKDPLHKRFLITYGPGHNVEEKLRLSGLELIVEI